VQSLIFILLLGIVQGILLGIFFLHRRMHHKGNFFLLLYLSAIILQLTLKLISKAWLLQHLNVVYTATYQLPFVYGPLIYLFVRGAFSREKFHAFHLLHFLPLFLILFHFAFSDPNQYPATFLVPLFNPFPRLVMQMASLVIYHYLALKEWKVYRDSSQQTFTAIYNAQVKWIPQFVYSSFFVTALVSLTIYYMYIYYPYLQPIRFGFAALTLFVYWVSYSVLHQPQLFSVIKGNGLDSALADLQPRLFIHRPAKKYANSTLRSEESHRIADSLCELVASKKIYLNPEVNIEDIAFQVGTSKHHLSQVLNENLNQSFNDYINHFRVEEAKQLLANPARRKHKIASIAFDSGFNSISTFNEVFKKFIGCTPSAYRKDTAIHSRKERV